MDSYWKWFLVGRVKDVEIEVIGRVDKDWSKKVWRKMGEEIDIVWVF